MRLLLICPWEGVRRAVSALASRRSISLWTAATAEEFLATQMKPDIVMIGGAIQPSSLLTFMEWSAAPNPIKVIFMSEELAAPELLKRAEAVKHADVVLGGPRFEVRILEALARALGIQPRVHTRRIFHRPAKLVSSGEEHTVMVENMSESGVKVTLDAQSHCDVEAALRLEWDDAHLFLPCEVVRASLEGNHWDVGLRFLKLSDRTRAALQKLLALPAGEAASASVPMQA